MNPSISLFSLLLLLNVSFIDCESSIGGATTAAAGDATTAAAPAATTTATAAPGGATTAAAGGATTAAPGGATTAAAGGATTAAAGGATTAAAGGATTAAAGGATTALGGPPSPPLIAGCTKSWTVEEGETCESIADDFDVGIGYFLAINPEIYCSDLFGPTNFVGYIVCVAT
jgi:hypothetical protein